MRGWLIVYLVASLLLAGHTNASGSKTYYRYVDAQGQLHFVDDLERIRPAQRAGARAVGNGKTGAVNRAGPSRRPSERPFSRVKVTPPPASIAEVVIYTAPWCGWCRKALAWLDERGVQYVNKDIERDPRNREELLEKTGRMAIPVVEIGDALIRGFDPDRMNELL